MVHPAANYTLLLRKPPIFHELQLLDKSKFADTPPYRILLTRGRPRESYMHISTVLGHGYSINVIVSQPSSYS